MQMDDLLQRYFGTRDLAAIAPAALPDGIARMRVDFGLATDRAARFALWSMLLVLGEAPEIEIAFAEAEDRAAARRLMEMLAAADPHES